MAGLFDNLFRRGEGNGLLGGRDLSGLGPALLALGAGIASGKGWGEGIGRGLLGASEAMRDQQLDALRKAALERENLNAASTAAYRAANLGLREREIASSESYRDAQIANLDNPQAKIGSTVEGIRGKLSRGETLTSGEQKVYEDVIRTDYLTRLLQGGGGGLPGAAAPIGAPSAPTAPLSTGPQPFQPSANLRKLGQVYNLPDGRQALWTQDASGKVGWEVLN